MIDTDWMQTLEFDSPHGRIAGLAGIGSQWLVFNLTTQDGKKQVLKAPNTPHIGWAIREIPPTMSSVPLYDVGRLNAKLLRLVGNDLLDDMCEGYNDLYSSILKFLHNEGFAGLLKFAAGNEVIKESLAFILQTPGMKRRLEDLAHLDLKTSAPGEVVLVNEMSGLIEDTRGNLVSWARQTLDAIQKSVPVSTALAPRELSRNPIYVWGAAVLDDFFTTEEMPVALEFIKRHCGSPAQGDHRLTFAEQAFALQMLLARTVDPKKTRRFVKFCLLAGFMIVDERGRPLSEDDIAPDRPETSKEEALEARKHRMPKLAHPSSVQAFHGEGELDPFGQNPALRRTAWREAAKFFGRHVARSHELGFAVSLPRSGVVEEPSWKPWRSVAPIAPDSLSLQSGSVPDAADLVLDATPARPIVLQWLQRCLVSASAFPVEQEDEYWRDFSNALGQLGFLALSRELDITQYPAWNAAYEIGAIAARLHGLNYIHGDLHPGNFTFKDNGKLESMFDLGRVGMPDRELTILERASDLAVLKKHSSLVAWEAAKAGYRSGAPQHADAVFALFSSNPQDEA